MSEFSLIETFVSAFDRVRAPSGPGDDAAVVARLRGDACVTTDAIVEGVHFRRSTFSWEDIGHKALAVNLSDLAAMGALPRWFVCAMAAPRSLTPDDARAMGRGMAALARRFRIALVGGNFTSASELSLTLTACGEVPRGRALLRSGGKPGHLLYVSGTLGDARLGLELLERPSSGSRSTLPRSRAARRQRRPEPRVTLGLLAREVASAALDVSDGLLQDLGHLCEASHVGARLDLDAVPLSPELRRWAKRHPEARAWALSGGEDYELLLAVPPARAAAFERACLRRGEPLHRIGELTARPRTGPIVQAAGLHLPPGQAPGFDHFSRSAHVQRRRRPPRGK